MFAHALNRQLWDVRESKVRAAASAAGLVKRLQRERTLEGHDGCVNTASFTPAGTSLLSGSDDRRIVLWDWQTGLQRLAYDSGHRNNVFQARALPGSNDATIVSCAADGQVRVAHIAEGGRAETQRLAVHGGRAHKLALQPDQPACFLSCGEDGVVRHFDLREGSGANSRRLLVCRAGSTGTGRSSSYVAAVELNSIHCSALKPWQFVVAGSDEAVRVYDRRGTSPSAAAPGTTASLATPVRKLMPGHMRDGSGRRRQMHVTCAMFSNTTGEIVATYNDEDIYLFAPEGQQAAAGARRRRSSFSKAASSGHSKRLDTNGGAASPAAATSVAAPGAATAGASAAAVSARDAPLARPAEPVKRSQPCRGAPGGASPAAAGGSDRSGDTGACADGGGALSGGAAVAPFRPSTTPPPATPPPQSEAAANHSETSPTAAGADATASASSPTAAAEVQHERDAADAGNGGRGGGGFSGVAARRQRLNAEWRRAEPEPGGTRRDDNSEDGPHHGCGGCLNGGGGAAGGDNALPPRVQRPRRNAFMVPPSALGALVDSSDDEDEARTDSREGGIDSQEPDEVVQRYSGHRNVQTVKGVAFCGANDEFVMSGSDCGNMFIWDKVSGEVVACHHGDDHVVNCLEQHPQLPLVLATSGIDNDVKIWAPTAEAEVPITGMVHEMMRTNRDRDRPRSLNQIVITPGMLRQLLMMHAGGVSSEPNEDDSSDQDYGMPGVQGGGGDDSEGNSDGDVRDWMREQEDSDEADEDDDDYSS